MKIIGKQRQHSEIENGPSVEIDCLHQFKRVFPHLFHFPNPHSLSQCMIESARAIRLFLAEYKARQNFSTNSSGNRRANSWWFLQKFHRNDFSWMVFCRVKTRMKRSQEREVKKNYVNDVHCSIGFLRS